MRDYWQFVCRNRMLLLFGFACVFWGNFGQSFYIGLFSEQIKAGLGLSASQYGTTYSLATLASAVSMLWLGPLIDRWPLRRFVLLVAAGLAVGSLLMSLANSLWVLALAFYCARLFGQGLLPHAGATTMARHFTVGRGKAISIAGTGVSVGEVVLPLLAVATLPLLGWQGTWLLTAVAVPLLFLPVAYGLLYQAQWQDLHLAHQHGVASKRSGRALLLRDRRYWLAAPTLLSVPFMLTAIFIHQDFILREKNWSAGWMASCFVFYGVVHWLGTVFSGVLVDRLSGVRLLRVYTLPLLAALLLVGNVDGQWVTPAMMALLGVSIGAAGPVVNALWAEVYGADVIGGVRSASGSIAVLVTALSPVGYGWLIDAGVSLQVLFNGSALVFVGALALLPLAYRA